MHRLATAVFLFALVVIAASDEDYMRPGAVGGRVAHADGSPAVGAVVTVLPKSGGEEKSTTVGPHGGFLIKGLREGLHRVRATFADEKRGLAAEMWVHTRFSNLRLTLGPSARSLLVRVLTPKGEPVPRFDARLLLPGGYLELGTQTDGMLATDWRWTGCVLELWGARDTNDHGLDYSPVRVGPLTSKQSELEVRLAEGPVLEGVVLGSEGPLAEPVEVELGPQRRWWEDWDPDDERDGEREVPEAGPLPHKLPFEGLTATVRTDDSGRFRVAFLQPGIVHVLHIDTPKGFVRFQRRRARVGDGPLEIRLQSPVKVRVTVLGPDQKPVRGVHVSALSPGSNGYGLGISTTTSADGVALLGDVEAGRFRLPLLGGGLDPTRKYKLVVNANYGPGISRDRQYASLLGEEVEPRSPPFLAEQARNDWLPTDTTVQLETGYTVSGGVLDTNDKPVSDRYVGLCTSVGFGCYKTQQDGRFTYHGIPAGTIYVGLDHGGDMTGIVDMLRGAMWHASLGDGDAPSPPASYVRAWTRLEVSGDLTDVILRAPATISAEVVLPPGADDTASGRPDLSRRMFEVTCVRILHRTEKGWEYFRSVMPGFDVSFSGRAGGALTCEGLVPGDTYAAWMPPTAGRYVYAEFPAEIGKLVLERKPGGTIQGQILDRPPSSTRVRVRVVDDRKRFVPEPRPDPEGRFEVTGLPDSTWTVTAWCRAADDVVWQAKETVATGKTVELRLAPRPAEEPK